MDVTPVVIVAVVVVMSITIEGVRVAAVHALLGTLLLLVVVVVAALALAPLPGTVVFEVSLPVGLSAGSFLGGPELLLGGVDVVTGVTVAVRPLPETLFLGDAVVVELARDLEEALFFGDAFGEDSGVERGVDLGVERILRRRPGPGELPADPLVAPDPPVAPPEPLPLAPR